MHNVIFDPIEHRYTVNDKEYPSYSKIAKHFGLTPNYDKWGNDTARNFGTAVHEMLKLYDLDDLGEFDERLTPWLDGYRTFLDVYFPQWSLIEEPLVSATWGFAGTPDRVGVINGKEVIIDFKTGAPEPSHAIQTAAYEVLVEEAVGKKKRKRCALYLMENDFRFIEHQDRSDRTIFLGLSQAYNWKLKNKLVKE